MKWTHKKYKVLDVKRCILRTQNIDILDLVGAVPLHTNIIDDSKFV